MFRNPNKSTSLQAILAAANSIQFNSIHVYLRANLTARRPITKYARVTIIMVMIMTETEKSSETLDVFLRIDVAHRDTV
jgi:hypothetical protein